MFDVIRLRRLGGRGAAICFLLAGFILLRSFSVKRALQVVELSEQRPMLVIDQGHGGFFRGAVAVNGVRESDINLAIGCKLDRLASLFGQRIVMTRSDDSRRSDLVSYSEHEDLVHT